MTQNINPLYFLSLSFIICFLIREYVAFKRNLTLKYLFTPLLTLLLVLIVVLSISINGADKYRVMILLSLLTALVADTLLMIEEVSMLKNGMIFFIMGHIFYVGAFTANMSFMLWNLILIIILAVFSSIYIRVLIKTAGKMFIPLLVYVIILDLMVYSAITRLNHDVSASAILVAVGAILFMISDFILSLNAFVKTIPNSTVYTWLLYAPAQFLIVLSTFNFL